MDMKTQTTITRALIIAGVLGATIVPALAVCPNLPDGPNSYNVANGQQRALCLQQQLNDRTHDRAAQTQFDTLKSTIQQQQIQRRFDIMPPITRPAPWER